MTSARQDISRRPGRASSVAVFLLLAAVALGGCSGGPADEPGPAQESASEPSAGPAAEQGSDVASKDTEETESDSDADADSDTVTDTESAAEQPSDEPGDGDGGEDVDTTGVADLNDLLGSGGCMASAGVLMGWGMALLGPLTEGTELLQQDVDSLFAASADMPAEIQPHIAVLRDSMNAAAGKSQAEVVAIVGTPEVSKAMEALTAYSNAACETE